MLRHRKTGTGVFVKLGATEVIDLAASCGLDFVVVDLEHSMLSEADALRLIRHAHALGLPALVRIPYVDGALVNRLLEAGATGIQLSTVRTVAEVEALRAACRYAPFGTRSISLAQPAANYGATPVADYLAQQSAEPPLIVAQIETATTDDPLPAILAAGVDVAFLGMLDLTVDLGLDAERVHERAEEVMAAAEDAGVTVGAFGLTDPRVGYRLVASDLALLRGALSELATPVRDVA